MVQLPTTNEDRIDVIDVFLESVDELNSSWFVKQVLDNGINATVTLLPDGTTEGDVVAPERDAIKAALLTLRFFIQSNTELSSVGNVAQIIAHSDLNVDAALVAEYEATRAELNTYLSGAPPVQFPAQFNATTREIIYRTILYGRFAHADIAKRKQALAWEVDPVCPLIRTEFLTIAMDFINFVDRLAQTLRKIRAEIA